MTQADAQRIAYRLLLDWRGDKVIDLSPSEVTLAALVTVELLAASRDNEIGRLEERIRDLVDENLGLESRVADLEEEMEEWETCLNSTKRLKRLQA